jgi:hypothetical protein
MIERPFESFRSFLIARGKRLEYRLDYARNEGAGRPALAARIAINLGPVVVDGGARYSATCRTSQRGQDFLSDGIVAKGCFVLSKAKASEPVAYIDRAPAGHGA